jgi:hypothetical protein
MAYNEAGKASSTASLFAPKIPEKKFTNQMFLFIGH